MGGGASHDNHGQLARLATSAASALAVAPRRARSPLDAQVLDYCRHRAPRRRLAHRRTPLRACAAPHVVPSGRALSSRRARLDMTDIHERALALVARGRSFPAFSNRRATGRSRRHRPPLEACVPLPLFLGKSTHGGTRLISR